MTGWGDASALLAEHGVVEDPGYYGRYTEPDQKAALTVAMRIQAAWAANDPDRFAGVFTEDGSLLMRDDQLTSREQIRSYMGRLFETTHRGARVQGWPISIQFLTEDVAMVITEGGVIMAGDDRITPANLIRATWVIVRRPDGAPRLVSHQSSPVKG